MAKETPCSNPKKLLWTILKTLVKGLFNPNAK